MENNLEPCIVGLAVQLAAIVLITTLSFVLTRTIRRQFLDYWTMAWASLSMALAYLLAAFCLPVKPGPGYFLYFLGEYTFGFFLISGCQNFATGSKPGRRSYCWLAAGGLVAAILPVLTDRFESMLVAHAAIVAGLWFTAFLFLRRAPRLVQGGPGPRVAAIALLLLAIDFLQYVAACAYASWADHPQPFSYFRYSSLYDLILEMLLAFGMLMIVMESVRKELEDANQELDSASKRLQLLAEQDPLTEALNRHAFHSFTQKEGAAPAQVLSGSVAVVDIDDFKTFNDVCGHAVGDMAIRAVAKAIRSVIRPDDLLFRWGGDEFLVLLPGLAEKSARDRFDRLNTALAQISIPGCAKPVAIGLSFGIAPYAAIASLDQSIDQADREMYSRKQARKASRSATGTPVLTPP